MRVTRRTINKYKKLTVQETKTAAKRKGRFKKEEKE